MIEAQETFEDTVTTESRESGTLGALLDAAIAARRNLNSISAPPKKKPASEIIPHDDLDMWGKETKRRAA